MANKLVTVLESDGVTETELTILDVGQQARAASKSVAFSTEDAALLDGIETSLTAIDGRVDGLEALLATQAGYLDGIETLITSTNTKLDSVITSVQLLDNAVNAQGALRIQPEKADGTDVDPLLPGTGVMAAAIAVTLATDDTLGITIRDAVRGLVDDAVFGVGSSYVKPMGFLADEGSPDSVDEGDIGAARMTLDRYIKAVIHEESNELRIGGAAVTVKFAAISASSSGDNTLLAAVTSKKIRVLSYSLMAAGAVNARFQTAVAGAYLTGLKYFAAAGAGIVAPYNPKGWFETVAGDLLNLELSGAVAVGGEFSYIEV